MRQQQVWDNVRKTQTKLTGNLGASVRSAQSASSLQLALENEKLMDAQKGYIEDLPDDYLAAAIADGGAAVGKSGFMPSWKTTLSEKDIADVIAYIRTFVVE